MNVEKFDLELTSSEIRSMTPVVDGLPLIHHDLDHVKHVLAHVVTMEMYEPFQFIHKKDHEDSISCYYILHGSVEATYEHTSGREIEVGQNHY